MFDRIRRLGRAKVPQTATENANGYDLANQPFSKALLLESARRYDEARAGLKSLTGGTRPLSHPKNLKEALENALVSETHRITFLALNKLGRAPFEPPEPIPKDASTILAFALSVLAPLESRVKAEGCIIDPKNVGNAICYLFFHGYPDEEVLKGINDGAKMFRELVNTDEPGAKAWQETIYNIMIVHMSQLMNGPKGTDVDLLPPLASMLKSFLDSSAKARI